MSKKHVRYVLVTKNIHIIENIITNYCQYIEHKQFMRMWLIKLRDRSHTFSMPKEYVNGDGLKLLLWGEPEDNFPGLKKINLGPGKFLKIVKERILAGSQTNDG